MIFSSNRDGDITLWNGYDRRSQDDCATRSKQPFPTSALAPPEPHWLRKSYTPTTAGFTALQISLMADTDEQGKSYEEEHVHDVYEQIASHFSSTRYKVCVALLSLAIGWTNRIQPWPIVERFLKEQRDGAIGADVGCGNGKYLAVNKNVFIVGSDR